MNERFGKDNVIALATMENNVPSVRYVNAYYENKVIYVDYYGYGDLKSCIDKIYNKIV